MGIARWVPHFDPVPPARGQRRHGSHLQRFALPRVVPVDLVSPLVSAQIDRGRVRWGSGAGGRRLSMPIPSCLRFQRTGSPFWSGQLSLAARAGRVNGGAAPGGALCSGKRGRKCSAVGPTIST